jgi:hypothetical protein
MDWLELAKMAGAHTSKSIVELSGHLFSSAFVSFCKVQKRYVHVLRSFCPYTSNAKL